MRVGNSIKVSIRNEMQKVKAKQEPGLHIRAFLSGFGVISLLYILAPCTFKQETVTDLYLNSIRVIINYRVGDYAHSKPCQQSSHKQEG